MTQSPSSPSPDDNYFVDKTDDHLARSFVGLGTQLAGKVINYFQDRRQATKAAEAYAQKYYDRYGRIRLFGMSQDIDLGAVYTGVKFLDKLSINQRFGSQQAVEEGYRSSGKRRFQTAESKPINGGKVANENQYLYVLGGPGAGKSTFLRRVGLEALKGTEGNYQHDCIPVMIELKQFNKGHVDLIAAIAEELAYFGFPDQKTATEHYLERGKLLLLFDGLDEVPQAYFEEIQEKIAKLNTKYSDNRMILSCRIAAYESAMTGFETVELADFDEEQIEKFIHNWFSSEKDRQNKVAEECWDQLKQPQYRASLELAQTPLLLAFLCITYDEYEDFPAQRHQLYAEALEILLRKWDAQKRGIKRDKIKNIYANWTTNLELALLAELAYDFFSENELFFSKEKVLEYIEVFLTETEGDAKQIDTEAVLEAIVLQQGILVERVKGIYSFSHLTLQEYLTAKFISEDNRRIEKLVKEHLTDERWQEVFLLLAGIKDKADDLLLLMEQTTHQLINTTKLRDLLVWVEAITNPVETDIKYLGKRALAIPNANPLAIPNANAIAIAEALAIPNANAIHNAFFGIAYICADIMPKARNIAHANAIAIGEFLEYLKWAKKWQIYNIDYNALISQLETLKKQISSDHHSPEIQQQFTQQLIDTWFSGFLTTREKMALSTEEIKILDRYLYSNLLMINCNKAANRVLQKTWSGIESRMLLPVSSES